MNLINALLALVCTVVLCALLTLLLDWPWIAAHWLRQLLVAILVISVLLMGLWITVQNLISTKQSKDS